MQYDRLLKRLINAFQERFNDFDKIYDTHVIYIKLGSIIYIN